MPDDPEAKIIKPHPRGAVLRLSNDIPSPLLQSSPSSYRWLSRAAILLLTVLVGTGAGALLYELKKRSSLSSTPRPSQTNTPLLATGNPSSAAEKSPAPSPTQVSKQLELIGSTSQNLSGKWNVVNIIDKTSHPSFSKLQIGYRLVINQTGTNFTAEGEKLFENGRTLPATGRTRIHVKGSIDDGDQVGATFVEEGARRKTNGRFVWRIDARGTRLTGTFVSSAARSSGTSVATKEP